MKCIALDIDGTLINSNHEITPRTLELLQQAIEAGYRLVLVTGRAYEMVKPLIEKYPLPFDLILNSGHEIIIPATTEHLYFPMRDELSKTLLTTLYEYGFNLIVATDHGRFVFDELDTFYQRHIQLSELMRGVSVSNLTHIPFFNPMQFLDNVHSVTSVSELINKQVKILKIDARNPDALKAKECGHIIRSFPHLRIDSSYEQYLECIDECATKASALTLYAQKFNISVDDIYVFGDSSNDLPMFETFPNSFAVANAHPHLKELAKWHVAHHDEEGVAQGLSQILNQK